MPGMLLLRASHCAVVGGSGSHRPDAGEAHARSGHGRCRSRKERVPKSRPGQGRHVGARRRLPRSQLLASVKMRPRSRSCRSGRSMPRPRSSGFSSSGRLADRSRGANGAASSWARRVCSSRPDVSASRLLASGSRRSIRRLLRPIAWRQGRRRSPRSRKIRLSVAVLGCQAADSFAITASSTSKFA